jgi:hypothetical protein
MDGNIAAALRYFIAFAQDAGAMTEAEGRDLWERGWVALGQAARRQADHQTANEPAQRFVELAKSALASGHAHLADRDGNQPVNPEAWGWRKHSVGTGAYARDEWQAQGDRIGWVDGPDVLLDPDASYKVAQIMAGTNGEGLSISARTLRKRLDEKHLLIRPGDRAELLARRVLQGQTRHVLHLAAGILSAQPTISAIPSSNGNYCPENEGEWGIPMVDNTPETRTIHQQNPPSTSSPGPETGPAGGNGGNGGKGVGKALGDWVA